MSAKRIRTKSDLPNDKIIIGGWLWGHQTYLWFRDLGNHCIGTISGNKLYRLAKAIVKQFESGREG